MIQLRETYVHARQLKHELLWIKIWYFFQNKQGINDLVFLIVLASIIKMRKTKNIYRFVTGSFIMHSIIVWKRILILSMFMCELKYITTK